MAKKIFFIIIAVGLICSSLYGQEAIPAPDQWQFTVSPYFWAGSVDGHEKFMGHKADVDISFNDILDDLNFDGGVHFEARKEKWGFFVDPMYVNLSESKDIILLIPGPVDLVQTINPTTKTDLTVWMVEFGGFYQIGQWCPSGESKRAIKLDLLGGGRYWNVKQNVSTGPVSGEVSEDWIDPFIGARLTAPINECIFLDMRADIGGFSVSKEASEQTWNIFVGPAFKLSERIDFVAGYRWLNLDRARSSNTNSDLTVHGPLVGLQIRL